MNPTRLTIVALLTLALGACAAPRPAMDASSAPALEFAPQSQNSPGSNPPQSSATGDVLGWAAAVPANVLYFPWKTIAQGGRGLYDGPAYGMNRGYPIMGLIFLPVNAAAGLGTGVVEGLAMEPLLYTPDVSYSRAMSKPLRLPVTVWWYGD